MVVDFMKYYCVHVGSPDSWVCTHGDFGGCNRADRNTSTSPQCAVLLLSTVVTSHPALQGSRGAGLAPVPEQIHRTPLSSEYGCNIVTMTEGKASIARKSEMAEFYY